MDKEEIRKAYLKWFHIKYNFNYYFLKKKHTRRF